MTTPLHATRCHTAAQWRRVPIVLLISILIAGHALVTQTSSVFAVDTCYAVANSDGMLVSLDKTDGSTVQIGLTGARDIEAIAFRPGTEILFAANGGELGVIDIVTGRYTPIGPIGTGQGGVGPVPFDDVDGLTWDSTTGRLFASHRRQGKTAADVLFQIDSSTGTFVPGAFGGADYVIIGLTSTGEPDIDDIAFHPVTGVLFGIANNGGVGGTLIRINRASGAISEVGPVVDAADPANVIDDLEGLDFFNDGNLYGSTGDWFTPTAEMNKLYRIDVDTGAAVLVGGFPEGHDDYEALACLTADIADDDLDGIVNSGEDINDNLLLSDDDTDLDGLPNYLDSDDDNDTIPTASEDANGDGNVFDADTDRDGLPNFLDDDDDNDGILTALEDVNANGNPLDDDADGDGISNYLESNTADHDGDGYTDYQDADSDGDSLPDGVETLQDRDRDGLPNYLDLDSDNDGLPDSAEWSTGVADPLHLCIASDARCYANDADGDTVANYLDTDADNDSVKDGDEPAVDYNGDGIPEWLDTAIVEKHFMPVIGRN